jgi:hypothetical protein
MSLQSVIIDGQPTASVYITVEEISAHIASGATVEVSADGVPFVVKESSTGVFEGAHPGDVHVFDVSVTHPKGSRTGIHVVGPAQSTTKYGDFSVNKPSSVQWSPNGDATVQVLFAISSTTAVNTFMVAMRPDSGELSFPASAFPTADKYEFTFNRERTWSSPGLDVFFQTGEQFTRDVQ